LLVAVEAEEALAQTQTQTLVQAGECKAQRVDHPNSSMARLTQSHPLQAGQEPVPQEAQEDKEMRPMVLVQL
jgi:hypothetical protein